MQKGILLPNLALEVCQGKDTPKAPNQTGFSRK
jgi:hypothetical protein